MDKWHLQFPHAACPMCGRSDSSLATQARSAEWRELFFDLVKVFASTHERDGTLLPDKTIVEYATSLTDAAIKAADERKE